MITGLGVVSPAGSGKEEFFSALNEGRDTAADISLFDTSGLAAKKAAEVKDFEPQQIIGKEGLRVLDRGTKLLACACKLALGDAGISVSEENAQDIGMVVGNTLGSLQSICDFDKVSLVEGPQYVNPSLFPNTVLNAQVSQASIRLNIKGFNITVSTGFSAGADAIIYAADLIRLGRGDIVLSGGVEELNYYSYLGFLKAGLLAGSAQGGPEISCPFDKRRNGFILAEGAGIIVLESLDSALKRKARVYARLNGYANSFGNGIEYSMRQAVSGAGMRPEDINYVCAAANSSPDIDRLEAEAIKQLFPKETAVSSVKSMIGEAFSASAAMQALAGVYALEKQAVLPNINYESRDPLCALENLCLKAGPARINNVLINSFCPKGNAASLILSKYD